jgi:hypothetical protein
MRRSSPSAFSPNYLINGSGKEAIFLVIFEIFPNPHTKLNTLLKVLFIACLTDIVMLLKKRDNLYFCSTGVWFVFVLLNTLQGLFIFVAFSCNKKIYEELKWNKPRQNRPQQQQQQQLPQPLAPNIALSVLPGLAHIL